MQQRNRRTLYLNLIIAILLSACGSKQTPPTAAHSVDSNTTIAKAKPVINTELPIAEDTEDAYATYFVVVADTGTNYYSLRDKRFALNKQLAIPIDTMDRYYNAAKNLIALPDDAEDDLYAGDYFPRRSPSENLSLEYLVVYKERSPEKTMALITGIYERESSADSAIAIIQKAEGRAFKLRSNIYVGCMH